MKNNPLLALVTNLVLLAGYSTTTEAQRTPKLAAIETDGLVTFYIAKGTEESRLKDTDSELAIWAINALEKSVDG